MMNAFIYSSNYSLDCILPSISFLVKKQIDCLFVYNELKKDNNLELPKIKMIKTGKNLEGMIAESDIIIIIDDGRISTQFLNIIVKTCKRIGKDKTMYILHYKNELRAKEITTRTEPVDYPVILLCYGGESSKIEELELLLVQYFNNEKIHIDHLFSNSTEILLDYFEKKDKKISLQPKKDKGSLLIETLEFNKLFSNDADIYKEIVTIKPDYVMFCVDHSFQETDKLYDLFNYKFNLTVDYVLKSDYFTYKEEKDDIGVQVCSIDNCDFLEKRQTSYLAVIDDIFHSMINRITLPKGVRRINVKK